MSSCLQAALEYAARGWSVIPVGTHGDRAKQPLVEWRAFCTRIASPAEIREWFTRWPAAGVGIVTGRVSGLVVVDFDGVPTDGWPATATVKTPRGEHRYYAIGAETIGTSAGVLAPGIDVRGECGYVVAAPTVRTDGGAYVWASESREPLWRPGAVVGTQSAARPTTQTATADADDEWGDIEVGGEHWIAQALASGVPDGQRTDTLTRLAGYFAARGVAVDIALVQLLAWAARCTPPLPPAKTMATVESVYRTAERRDQERATGAVSVKPLTEDGAAKPAEKPVRVLSWYDFAVRHGGAEIDWLVEGWVPRGSIGFVVSPPECFKSWLVGALAVSAVSGVPFVDGSRVSKPGPVLVLQQEDHHGQTANRFMTMVSVMGRELPREEWALGPECFSRLYIQDDREFHFARADSMAALNELLHSIRPALVIMDPLYSMVTTDDYMVKAATQMRQLKLWRDSLGVTFLLVHHAGKSREINFDRERAWGSQFLNAFVEFGMQIAKLDDTVTLTKRHFKMAPAGPVVRATWHICTEVDGMEFAVDCEALSGEELDEILAEHNERKAPRKARAKKLDVEDFDAMASSAQAEVVAFLQCRGGSADAADLRAACGDEAYKWAASEARKRGGALTHGGGKSGSVFRLRKP